MTSVPGLEATRDEHKAFAERHGYFWVPCARCGRWFGGHEARGFSVRTADADTFFVACCRADATPIEPARVLEYRLARGDALLDVAREYCASTYDLLDVVDERDALRNLLDDAMTVLGRMTHPSNWNGRMRDLARETLARLQTGLAELAHKLTGKGRR